MQLLHLDLRQFNDEQAELRYFFDNPNNYEERSLALIEIQDLLQVSDRDYYTSLPENFTKTGLMLYDWLDGSERWLSAAIAKCRRQGLVLAIATTGKLAHLPWELLHDGKCFLVERINPAVVPVRWLPEEESGQDAPAPRALRVLFTATSPENVTPVLDFEAEEGRILKATARQPIELMVEESGCLEELANLVASYDKAYFDVLHLTGHATIADDCPYFLTETETGEAYPASTHEIAEKLEFRLPPLIFLSGCRTGEAGKAGAVPSMAEQLLQQGARAVLGWGRPVLEGDATAAAAELYQSLAAGYELAQAVAKTYQALIKNKARDWHLLRLYVAGEVPGALVTPLRTPGRPPAPLHPSVADTTRALDTAGQVKVCNPAGFVGRRRQLQHCLRALKYDPEKVGVLIYGMGGLGKSTLAMRLSDRLPNYERVVWVGQVDEASLVKRLSERFDDLELQKCLQATEPELKFRLRKLFRQIEQTNHQPFLLVLDDFETNLEPRQGKFILSAKTAKVLEALIFAIREQGRISHRVVITCRYDFDSPHLQYFHKQPLTRLGNADLDKKCSRLPSFSVQSQVDSALQAQAKRLADGNPRLLEWLDKVLQDSTVERAAILNHLEADPIELREQVLAQVLLRQVDRPLQKMLGLGLVFEIPVPRAALQELCASIPNLDSHIDRAIGLGLLEVSTHDFLRVPRILPLTLPENTEALCSQATKILYKIWRIKEREILREEQWVEVHRLALLGKEEEIAAEISFILSTLWNHNNQFCKAVEIGCKTLKVIRSNSLNKIKNLMELGNAYSSLSKYKQAIACYKQALSVTNAAQNTQYVEAILGNLSTCYADLGQITQAIFYTKQALEKARKDGNRELESRWLNNLGNYCAQLGKMNQAIALYQKSQKIAVEMSMKGACLGNLCYLYGLMGQSRRAIDYGEQALVIQETIQNWSAKGTTLHSLAQAYIDEGRYTEAIECAKIGAKIGEQIGSPKLQSENYSALACAYLYSSPGDFCEAWTDAKAAQQYDLPDNNHYVSLLLGIIALRRGDRITAREAFSAAQTQTCALLRRNQQNYRALDTKWLALCGLALCGQRDCVSAAIDSYRALRESVEDEGLIKRSCNLLKALLLADSEHILAEVCQEVMQLK